MNDLISRQAVIEAIEIHIRTAEEPYQLTEKERWINYGFDVALNCICNLPNAEPEIIRCRDCKHSSHCYSEVHMLNKMRSTSICKDISFCSFAERRTDG